MDHTRMTVRGAAFAAAGLILLAARPVAAEVKHPAAHHAIHASAAAIKDLQGAKHDFGGYKERAIASLQAAILQTEKALEQAGDTAKPADLAGGSQPGLHHAAGKISEAIHELEKSKHIGAAHRDAAIRDLKIAHADVELCIKHAKPAPKKK